MVAKKNLGGRPSYFRGKSASPGSASESKIPKKRTLNLTWTATDILDGKRERLKISSNDFVEALIRKYGKGLTIADVESVADR